MVERRALVRLFLDANLRGGTQVPDAEVAALYESGEHPFLGQELEEVREPLRALIRRRRIETAVARWIEVLRTRTTVQLFASYATGPDAVPTPNTTATPGERTTHPEGGGEAGTLPQ